MLVPMLMNLGNPPGASNTGTQPPPTMSSSNGTFLMIGVGMILVMLLV